jgi:hypothetical protein
VEYLVSLNLINTIVSAITSGQERMDSNSKGDYLYSKRAIKPEEQDE